MDLFSFLLGLISLSPGGSGGAGGVGGQAKLLLQPEREAGEIDVSDYEEHAQRGNELAEQMEQAKDRQAHEITSDQKRTAGANKPKDVEESVARGARLFALAKAEQDGNARADASNAMAQATPVVAPSSFKTFLTGKQQSQKSNADTTPAPTQRHTPGHNL